MLHRFYASEYRFQQAIQLYLHSLRFPPISSIRSSLLSRHTCTLLPFKIPVQCLRLMKNGFHLGVSRCAMGFRPGLDEAPRNLQHCLRKRTCKRQQKVHKIQTVFPQLLHTEALPPHHPKPLVVVAEVGLPKVSPRHMMSLDIFGAHLMMIL